MIYFGPDKWNAPRTLHEMFPAQAKGLLAFVPDYRINLFEPQAMSEEEIQRFQMEFREVMLFIKHSQDTEWLRARVAGKDGFRPLSRETVEFFPNGEGKASRHVGNSSLPPLWKVAARSADG